MTLLPLIVFPLLYAETHYRFKYFFSFLKKNEPEILADIPHRLEPNAALPGTVDHKRQQPLSDRIDSRDN